MSGKRNNICLVRDTTAPFAAFPIAVKNCEQTGWIPFTNVIGGGLCNLANTIHRVVLVSPLTVTEFHKHSDALAPDEGLRVPFSSGTSVFYNNGDYRFKNETDQTFQLLLWCDEDNLYAELRCEHPLPCRYRIVEEGHHFQKEGGKYYRVSKIYKETLDAQTGQLLHRELVLDNHSEVMYDPALIPGVEKL